MKNDMRTWLTIKDGAIKGEQTRKHVKRSDFSEIRGLEFEEEGDGSTIISYELAGMWFGKTVFDGETYETLEIPGAGNIEIERAPELPQEGLFVAIPENADVTEVVFSSEGRWTRRLQNLVRPVSKPVRGMERPQYDPDPRIYGIDRLYPPGDSPGRLIGTKRIAGRKVAHIMLYPVQYGPTLNLVAHKSIEIKITYRKEPGTDRVAPRRILQTAPADRLILDSATQLKAEGERLMSEPHSPHCSSLSDCNNEGEYLIITTRDLRDSHSLDDLVTARARDHIVVKVVTMEDILEQFQVDPPKPPDEVISYFLRYACEHWKIEKTPKWVILAGDTKDIPTHVQAYEEETAQGTPLASDHFYADLWGDLAPDLVVSRLPTSDFDEMAEICTNAAGSGGHDPSWANKILFITYADPDDSKTPDRISCAQEVADKIDDLYIVTKIPIDPDNCQGPVAGAIAAINKGIGLVNYLGHGRETGWNVGLQDTDLSRLTNGGRLGVVFSIACNTNRIDYSTPSYEKPVTDGRKEDTCFGECWIRDGKAVAFLGASRSAYSVPDLAFQKFLFDAMIPKKSEDSGKEVPSLTRIGDIMNFAKTQLYLNSTATNPAEDTGINPAEDMGSNQVKDNIRMYLLLGDPCATFGEIK